jgi:hypothetical protein
VSLIDCWQAGLQLIILLKTISEIVPEFSFYQKIDNVPRLTLFYTCIIQLVSRHPKIKYNTKK